MGMPAAASGSWVAGCSTLAPKVASSAASSYVADASVRASGTMRGSAVMSPFTSVQISTRSASSAAPSSDAVKSEPPRPRMVGRPDGGGPDEALRERDAAGLEQRRQHLLRGHADRVELGRRAAVPVIGDDDLPGIDPGRRDAGAGERRRDQVRAPQLALPEQEVALRRRQDPADGGAQHAAQVGEGGVEGGQRRLATLEFMGDRAVPVVQRLQRRLERRAMALPHALGECHQAVGDARERRHHHDRLLVLARGHDLREAEHGLGVLHRRTAELADDHPAILIRAVPRP